MKNILITGANTGIGYYMVLELLERKYNVFVLDINTDNLEKIKESFPNFNYYKCDVSDFERVRECVNSITTKTDIECAIHNACLCSFKSMEDTDNDTYKRVFEVNYLGALNLTKVVIQNMKKNGERLSIQVPEWELWDLST